MKRLTIVTITALMLGMVLAPPSSSADDEPLLTGDVNIGIMSITNKRQSAKFEEYRAFPSGVSIGSIDLGYRGADRFYGLTAKDVGLDDQYFSFQTGIYGRYSLNLYYNSTPHRFAYDARTLYTGVGTGNLTLNTPMRTALQNSTSATNLATNLASYFTNANTTDIGLLRKTIGGDFTIATSKTVNMTLGFSREQRNGTRPIFGSFGFGSTIELPEPIDYDTTQAKMSFDYNHSNVYMNAAYNLSHFADNISTLSWDNPFRAVDSTSSSAYTATYAAGSASGRMAMYPSNDSHDLSFTGSVTKLPWNSRLSATASLGQMTQNDPFIPYTSNTAIQGKGLNGASFAASDPAQLSNPNNYPATSANAKVDTSLYNVVWTARPVSKLGLTARFRQYAYANKTPSLTFPGYVRTDAVWEAGSVTTTPDSYSTATTGLDATYDLMPRTSLELGFQSELLKRSFNYEVERSRENKATLGVESRVRDWLTVRANFVHARRSGTYIADGTSDLPWIYKYDQADRTTNSYRFLVTATPIDPLSLTLTYDQSKEDYTDSIFGLLNNKYRILSLDMDYSLPGGSSLSLFASHERYKYLQLDRQWNPNSPGDPYNNDTTPVSNSNWSANSEDRVTTFGGGFSYPLVPKKLTWNLTWSNTKSTGGIDFYSPLGTSANDANAFTPIGFPNVDASTLTNVDVRLKYSVIKDVSAALGFAWEGFQTNDYNSTGFAYIPTTAAGGYNGALLMGTLPASYSVHILYTSLSFKF